MAFLLSHTFVFSCLPQNFWESILVLLIIEALKEEGWVVFVAELYGFCLSIAYIARLHHPYIESLSTLIIFGHSIN